jgi:hypothetical protein
MLLFLVSGVLEDLCSPLSLFVFISVAVSSQGAVLFCSGRGSSPDAGFDSSLLLPVKKKILLASILLLSCFPAHGFFFLSTVRARRPLPACIPLWFWLCRSKDLVLFLLLICLMV